MGRIVIVGGMGPQASLELHKRIINRANERGSVNGDEFPEILHLSLPIDDFIASPSKMHAALGVITSALERLYLWQGRPSGYSL